MSEESIVKTKAGELYKAICQSEWNPTVTGVVIAFLSVMMMAWWRPWGAVGALRNWGDWIMYWLAGLLGTDAGIFAFYEEAPRSVFIDSGSIIGIGFIGGAFISACLGQGFCLQDSPLSGDGQGDHRRYPDGRWRLACRRVQCRGVL